MRKNKTGGADSAHPKSKPETRNLVDPSPPLVNEDGRDKDQVSKLLSEVLLDEN